MTEQPHSEDRRKDALDALEAMASGRDAQPAPEGGEGDDSGDSAADLGRLAEGLDQADEGDGEELAELTLGGDEPIPADVAVPVEEEGFPLAGLPATAPTPAAKRARAANFHKRSGAAHAHHFRRTMIPLLLTVGGLLFLLAIGTLVMMATTEEAALQQNPYLMRYGKWCIIAAFPLGAILLVGAWLFHGDVKRSEQK